MIATFAAQAAHEASTGADFPILSALAWGSVGGGLVLLGVAAMLIVMGTTAQRREPAPALAPA